MTAPGAGAGGGLRLAAVSYVNAWPLLEGLDEEPGVELVTGPPSAVADLLARGAVDAGLVPSIELLRQDGLEPVAGLGIAAFGPVQSVLVLLRTAPHRVRSLVLDPASRTSQVLALIVLERSFGVRPATIEASPLEAWREGRADAVLVIGDPALEALREGAPCIDLAEEWARMTGLPFVFAVWGATPRARARDAGLAAILDAAHRRGRGAIPALARRAAERGPLDAEGFEVYLTRRIRYGLGDPELRGLRRFLEMARIVPEAGGTRCST